MTEQELDMEFIKENLSQRELLGQIGISALKALVTTAIIIGAVFFVSEHPDSLRGHPFLCICSGHFRILISIGLAVHYYYKNCINGLIFCIQQQLTVETTLANSQCGH